MDLIVPMVLIMRLEEMVLCRGDEKEKITEGSLACDGCGSLSNIFLKYIYPGQ